MIEVQALLKTIFESILARFLTRTLSWDLKRAYLRDACKSGVSVLNISVDSGTCTYSSAGGDWLMAMCETSFCWCPGPQCLNCNELYG